MGLSPCPAALQWLPHVSFGPMPPALTLGMFLGWQPQALGKGVHSGRLRSTRPAAGGGKWGGP